MAIKRQTKVLLAGGIILAGIIYLFGLEGVKSILTNWKIILMSVGGISTLRFFTKR
jgi:hypothetical protein